EATIFALVRAGIGKVQNLDEPVHGVCRRLKLVVESKRPRVALEARFEEEAKIKVLVDLGCVDDRTNAGSTEPRDIQKSTVVLNWIAFLPGSSKVIDHFLEGLSRIEAVTPRNVPNSIVRAIEILHGEEGNIARRRTIGDSVDKIRKILLEVRA